MGLLTKNLVYLRKSKRLSQKEAAEKLDLTRPNLSSYEIGRSEPNIETLIRIAGFYHVSLDLLLCQDISKIEDVENIINQVNEAAGKKSGRAGDTIAEDDEGKYYVKEQIEGKDKLIQSQKEVIETQKVLITSLNTNIQMLTRRVEELEKRAIK